MGFCINPNCPKPQNRDTMLFCQSCGSELLLDGHYRVIRELGGGGFGKTYEVRDCKLKYTSAPTEAIKVLKVLVNDEPKYVELFKREAQVLMQLNHPGIPKVEVDNYFIFQPRLSRMTLHCIVMQKIEGLDLEQYIEQRGQPIHQKLGIEWLLEITDILKEVHAHNFFHRDIKPSNIMLRADGQLVLIDFGSVREVTSTYLSKQSAGMITGIISTGYTPIEQMHGQALPQSDFFALGRTMVYLLTTKEPREFYDSYLDNLRWRQAAPQVSSQFADFIDRLMAPMPAQRPQSPESIIKEVEQIYYSLYGHRITHIYPPPATNNQSSPKTNSVQFQLDPSFVSRAQAELAQFIGPMASVVCQQMLKQNPQITETDLVEKLAKTIPDAEHAEQFKQRLLGI